MANYTVKDLEECSLRIENIAKNFGLDHFEVVYELCDHITMINKMAYSGIPSRYRHWSFGKYFEVVNTEYYYGVMGLPYEMVVNGDPSLAYLMADNPVSVQVLVMAHVLGHVNFFKNNYIFRTTHPSDALVRFKLHARRINEFIDQYGLAKVEKFLDAARSLEYNCSCGALIKGCSQDETERRLYEEDGEAIRKVPKPKDDILLFIRDNNSLLERWQKDIITMIDEEGKYFLPQIETKIMNEGWATFWHYNIINALELPFGMYMEFLKLHNRIILPVGNSVNPYSLGFLVWNELEKQRGKDKLFDIMAFNRDVSFLRQFLSKELVGKLHLFSYKKKNSSSVVVKEVADESGWKEVRNELLRWVGVNSLPTIKVTDLESNGTLVLTYFSDGRKLEQEYKEHTLKHIGYLWGNKVKLLEIREA